VSGPPHASLGRIRAVDALGFPETASWSGATALAPLRRSQDGAAPRRSTTVRVGLTTEALHVRFDCLGPRRQCRHVTRDAPLWEEDVVEVFLAGGPGVPIRYAEIEVNPAGALFDAMIDNPDGHRGTMRADPGWDAPGLRARVSADSARGWTVELQVPWGAIGAGPGGFEALRANFYRIDRPADGDPEFTAWSPTLVDPPDFHKPDRFGLLLRP